MNDIEKNIYQDSEAGKEPFSFPGKPEAPFNRSKDDVWNAIERKMENYKPARVISFRRPLLIAVAASFIVLLGIASVLRFYRVSYETPRGDHLLVNLPCGSVVELNAQTTLSYSPLLWRFSRKVNFEGEGYFEVKKGSNFEVESMYGTTKVLGTSFNIFARDEEYKVTCYTGSVKVVSNTEQEVIIKPEYKAEIDIKGNIVVEKMKNPTVQVEWINNMFVFTGRPLEKVFEEIERQYDVNIQFSSVIKYKYTGNFSKDTPLDTVLLLVGRPFGFSFVSRSEGEYQIVKPNYK